VAQTHERIEKTLVERPSVKHAWQTSAAANATCTSGEVAKAENSEKLNSVDGR